HAVGIARDHAELQPGFVLLESGAVEPGIRADHVDIEAEGRIQPVPTVDADDLQIAGAIGDGQGHCHVRGFAHRLCHLENSRCRG
nr:hypothetical protein [Tanacetum cinerariifolium]